MSLSASALLDFASPFHVCCDREWKVASVGPSMAEHLDFDPTGRCLSDLLEFTRPKVSHPDGLNKLPRQLILLKLKGSGLDLRGQWNDMPWPGLDSGEAGRVLLCSPWVTSEDQWRQTGLKLRQLGPQDSSGEYLLLLAAAREQALDVARLADLATIRESRLERLVQRMREGLLLIDSEGRIESANPAACMLLGFRSTKIEGSLLDDLFSALPKQEDSSEDLEWLVKKSTGDNFKARGSRYSIRTRQGETHALLFRDVSEEEQALQMRRTFLSMVSHELRTPLSAIKAPLGMSLSGHLGQLAPKVRDVLEIATRNADRLHQLVDDVIDLERLESNALPLNPSKFKSGTLTQKLLDGLGTTATDAHVALDFEDDDFSLVGDQGRILQVITNLVINAIRHSPNGSTVHLRVLQQGSNARCEVTDEGPGIPEELRSRIFDRFFQVNSGTEQPTGGTGLGLAISRLIISQHGGQIGVETGPRGCGSTFWLELPIAGR
ncbi:MAG: ATP-binding protein [Planctomycetota bacterium]|nr:ATP-binding protein [Planctomycetota bacterium]